MPATIVAVTAVATCPPSPVQPGVNVYLRGKHTVTVDNTSSSTTVVCDVEISIEDDRSHQTAQKHTFIVSPRETETATYDLPLKVAYQRTEAGEHLVVARTIARIGSDERVAKGDCKFTSVD